MSFARISQFDPLETHSTRFKTSKYDEHEEEIKKNIHKICLNMLTIDEHLENLERNFVSSRIADTLHSKLKETFEIIIQTDSIFKNWSDILVDDPSERLRKKLSLEKLYAQFQAEVKKVHEVSKKIRDAVTRYEEDKKSGRNKGDRYEINNFIRPSDVTKYHDDDIGTGIYADENCDDNTAIKPMSFKEMDSMSEHENLIKKEIIDDRFVGISKIAVQISEVGQAFKELANLVVAQSKPLGIIESNIYTIQSKNESANMELTKAYNNQYRSRKHCLILLLLLCGVIGIIFLIQQSNRAKSRATINSFDASSANNGAEDMNKHSTLYLEQTSNKPTLTLVDKNLKKNGANRSDLVLTKQNMRENYNR